MEAEDIKRFVMKYHVYLSSDMNDDSVNEKMKSDGVMAIDRQRIIKQRIYNRDKQLKSEAFNAGCRKAGLLILGIIVAIFICAVVVGITLGHR